MKYNKFKDDNISALGFGCMRFPVLSDGSIDEATVEKMFDLAIKNGVNYFDTAWPYHGGMSEVVTGKVLKKYPRESFYLADKYPGHQLLDKSKKKYYQPDIIFNKQLEKTGVEYFDYYLLHNVCESSESVFEDDELGVIPYFQEQVKQGKIRHLGFSSHAKYENLKAFLDKHPNTFEFCQIQLNYMDWTLQEAKEKYELLQDRGIGIWVMEGIRGGKLANLPEDMHTKLQSLKPGLSDAAWAIRWIQSLPSVVVQLSGMSNLEQVEDNLKTMENETTLSDSEFNMLLEFGDKLNITIPCTKCKYCTDGCPMKLDIPDLISWYNDYLTHAGSTVQMYIEQLPDEKKPSACIACGKCKKMCPQGIDIPEVLKTFAEKYGQSKTWKETCRERDEAAGFK